MPLTDRQIVALKPGKTTRKFSDGGGLHVVVPPNGSKLWRLAYRYNGKQKLLSFGPYPSVSLADARKKRDAAKSHLVNGRDPSAEAKIEKAKQKASSEHTFRSVAIEMIAKNEQEGLAAVSLTKKRWLLDLVTPDIGERPVSELSAAEVLIPLKRIESAGNYETAKRLRSFVGQVCRYAISTARATNDPTFGLKGALVAPKVNHMAAATNWEELKRLVKSIWDYSGRIETQNALKLMVLLYPRPGELRMAEWTDVNFEEGTWTIPAARTKMRRVHKKPLSDLAIRILAEQRRHSGNRRLVFPAMGNANRPMSENTMNGALRRMGFSPSEVTSHGFRATASTLLNESGLWPEDAIEAELAHVGKDEVRRAYHRALYWDERVKMSDWWSERIEAVANSATE